MFRTWLELEAPDGSSHTVVLYRGPSRRTAKMISNSAVKHAFGTIVKVVKVVAWEEEL